MDIADKIRKIEALIFGAKSDGERQAAEFAKQRLQDKIAARPVEYTVRVNSPWKKRLFLAICKKHGLRTYRYMRQKYTTTMLHVSKSFMDSISWLEFNKYSLMLDTLTDEILTDLISKIHLVGEDESVIAGELPVMQGIVL
jgi:hypothetical protein